MSGRNADPWLGLRGNLLLRALSPRDALALVPGIERRSFRVGEPVAGETRGDIVLFPETLVASLCTADAARTDVALVGYEGVLGWGALFGADLPEAHGNRCIGAGTALAIESARLAAACAVSPALGLLLMGYLQNLTLQMSRTIAVNLLEGIERRLSRWLLMLHDRSEGDDLAITHGALAELVNVRRAGITEALHRLEGARLVRCVRGRVAVCDRAGLEASAAAAYGATERNYRSLIGRFGKSAESN